MSRVFSSFALAARALLALGLLGVASVARAAPPTVYSDRASWEAAVGGSFGDVDIAGQVPESATLLAGSPLLLPNGGSLSFDIDLFGLQVPTSWATWSNGEEPAVLYTLGFTQVSGSFDAPVGSFGVEMEPNPSSVFDMTLQLADGSTLTQPVDGVGGAGFFGWVGGAVVGLTLSCSDCDFAFGRAVASDVGGDPCAGFTPASAPVQLQGTSGRDVLLGSEGDDEIVGGAGNDTICGFGGSDVLTGGSGNDVVFGGEGDDELRGSSGRDQLDGGAGADRIVGGAGDDELLGQDGNDTLLGESGSDAIDAGAGDDCVNAGAGDDGVECGDGSDDLDPSSGSDAISQCEPVPTICSAAGGGGGGGGGDPDPGR